MSNLQRKGLSGGSVENRLRRKRMENGLSQGELAKQAGLTRQALYAIESNHYLPGTEISLRLAKILGCSVEDLFNFEVGGELIEADLVESISEVSLPVRAKVARVGNRLLARPVSTLGELLNYMVTADGLIVEQVQKRGRSELGGRVRLQLLQDRQAIEEEIVIAGCDPAMYLAAEHFRRYRDGVSVVGCTMGSVAAIEALRREEVHVAGLHLVDEKSGQSNLPYLKRCLKSGRFTVIRFAAWEQGLMVLRHNPKKIRGVEDLTRRGVRFVNREAGSGARLLLDSLLAKAGIGPKEIKGIQTEVFSHLEVGRSIVEGRADVGIGVQSAALQFGLDFVPLQEEHYDLVMPSHYLTSHPSLSRFIDSLVGKPFRKEVEALGGYDVKEIGKVLEWK